MASANRNQGQAQPPQARPLPRSYKRPSLEEFVAEGNKPEDYEAFFEKREADLSKEFVRSRTPAKAEEDPKAPPPRPAKHEIVKPKRPGLVQVQALETCQANSMPHFKGELFFTNKETAERLEAKGRVRLV